MMSCRNTAHFVFKGNKIMNGENLVWVKIINPVGYRDIARRAGEIIQMHTSDLELYKIDIQILTEEEANMEMNQDSEESGTVVQGVLTRKDILTEEPKEPQVIVDIKEKKAKKNKDK